MLTEYEWRKQSSRRFRRKPAYCGAQCVLKEKNGRKLMGDRSFHVFLLLLSLSCAVMLPVLVPRKPTERFSNISGVSEAGIQQPRKISAVSYQLPTQLDYAQHTYTRTQLLGGRMLLVDQEHPLPKEVPPPNTMSIAVYGRGRVPVRDLQLKSGRETIEALAQMFEALNAQRSNGLSVWDATHSAAEQRQRIEKHARLLMQTVSPEAAVNRTLQEMDWPNSGELQQEYTVEIRPVDPQNIGVWQTLMQTAWRYGFVRTDPEGEGRLAYRFRWVGKAHATAMTYLDLSLKEYLLWLHEKGSIAIEDQGKLRYLILCQPMNGTHTAFQLPIGAEYEASLDNMGYAVVACTLP